MYTSIERGSLISETNNGTETEKIQYYQSQRECYRDNLSLCTFDLSVYSSC